MKKLASFIFIPGLIMALVFVVCGDSFEASFSQESFQKSHQNTSNAWLIAIGLMISDLFLPIPASGIMAAIGVIYGFQLGFIINFAGTMSSGLVAYALARLLGKKGISKICSPQEVEDYKEFFDRWGGLAIIASRFLPILPEVLSVAAGFSSMNCKKFSLALTLGSLATWLGYYFSFK